MSNKELDIEKIEEQEELRTIIERSSSFLSLSGWSGIWAGSMALAGALIAHNWITELQHQELPVDRYGYFTATVLKFIFLAVVIFLAAVGGGFYFTIKKAKLDGKGLWNTTTRKLLAHMAIPMVTGGIFVMAFLMQGNDEYVGATCLTFYGLSLINANKYTNSGIHYLGLMEIALGGICIFFPGYGLYFWAAGFGLLHILYGIFMWNKQQKK
ncbi:MAG: hypothetical protein WCG87_02915 [Bacteroidota bacterium]